MKFSEIDDQSWAELQPYLDTCLLPVSGLTGTEAPWEAKEKIMRTGDWLSVLERSFHGRTVTLPAYHYNQAAPDAADRLNDMCERFKSSGYKYVVVVCGQAGGVSERVTAANMIVQPDVEHDEPDEGKLRAAVSAMWRGGAVRS